MVKNFVNTVQIKHHLTGDKYEVRVNTKELIGMAEFGKPLKKNETELGKIVKILPCKD
jgi:hypothetical protein